MDRREALTRRARQKRGIPVDSKHPLII
jgi:hypothetical protein